jgi:hypothetical protein
MGDIGERRAHYEVLSAHGLHTDPMPTPVPEPGPLPDPVPNPEPLPGPMAERDR